MSILDFLARRTDGRAAPIPTDFDRAEFFNVCRDGIMGPTLSDNEVSGTEAILDAVSGLPVSWVAYALATAWHETAHSMQPIRERGGPAYFHRMYDIEGHRPALARKMGNRNPGDGARYCGRGYVQLTWRRNYVLAGQKLGQPLEAQPEIAMRPDVAAAILRHGMVEGWFTGKGFRHYLPSTGLANRPAFTAARQIINGMDKAALIAGYALDFQRALQKGGWK